MRGRQHDQAADTSRAGEQPRLMWLRPTASRGPCGGARRGSSGRRGCACAGGSRGSWTVGGCSAGRCACSRHYSVTWVGPGPVVLACGVPFRRTLTAVSHRRNCDVGTTQKVSRQLYGPPGTTVKPSERDGLRRSRISTERTIGARRDTSTKPTRRELPGNLPERVAGCRSELLASALPAQVTVYSHSVYNSVDNRRTMAAGRDPVTDVPPVQAAKKPRFRHVTRHLNRREVRP